MVLLDELKNVRAFFRPVSVSLMVDNRVFVNRLFVANNPLKLGFGLVGRSLREGEGMIFFLPSSRVVSLHMFFVPRSIDVLFCRISGDSLRIVEVKRFFAPFTACSSQQPVDVFVELPAGTVDSFSLKPGDVVSFSGGF